MHDTILETRTKRCPNCKEIKTSSEFYFVRIKNGSKRLKTYCKPCEIKRVGEYTKRFRTNPENITKLREARLKAYRANPEAFRVRHRKWRAAHREEANQSTRRWALNNPEKVIERRRLYCYGMTQTQYESLLAKQLGVCAICKHVSDDGRQLCVDHNHKTGEIRGLLCSLCNSGIGMFKDNKQLLEGAIEYLKQNGI